MILLSAYTFYAIVLRESPVEGLPVDYPEVNAEDEVDSSVERELEVDEEGDIVEEAVEVAFYVWFDLSDVPRLPPEDDLLSLEPLVLIFEEDQLGDFI